VLRTDCRDGGGDWPSYPSPRNTEPALERGIDIISDPIFDNEGKQVARRIGNEAVSLDGKQKYSIDPNGNLLDQTGAIVGHLIPSGEYLPDGRRSPAQSLF
jgi:hypothetical protein